MKKSLIVLFAIFGLQFGAYAQTYFQDGFETAAPNTLPSGWIHINLDGFPNDTAGSHITWANFGVTFCAHTGNATATNSTPPTKHRNDWMITPLIDLSTASGFVALKFYATTLSNISTTSTVKILVSQTGTNVSDFTDTIVSLNLLYQSSGLGYVYSSYAYNISQFAGDQIYIAFVNATHNTNTSNWGTVAIDDIKVFDSLVVTSKHEYPLTFNSNTQFECYPNPASDKIAFHINTDEPLILTIFDALGQIVLSKIKVMNNETIDIENLGDGIFFCRLSNNKGLTRTGKFIKQ